MCEQCENILKQVSKHISDLCDALKIGSDNPWEVSEPFAVGGPNGQYTLRAPFTGDCEFKVDFAGAGASQTQMVVSSTKHTSGVDFTGAGQSFQELSAFDGLVMSLPPNTPIPIDSEWYYVRNSSNTLFILVISAANAAFANILFRQKR